MSQDDERLRELVAEVAAAYFSNSHTSPSDIATVMAQITASLQAVGSAQVEPEVIEDLPAAAQLTSAQIRKSVRPEGLVSFEDGKPYKTLRRHLAARGLTPDAYRAKWGLPDDYPMVSPNYSAARSEMAKTLGFGRKAAPEPVRRGPGRPKSTTSA